jgi:hypothetical protein
LPATCLVNTCAMPHTAAMQVHHDSRHPTLPWEPEKCTDLHSLHGGVTTQGVAVRGSHKK